ncbi:MAG: hypothetical protein IT297_00375 [Anaerolineae bacterium]|jgi:aspartyl/glutamyl-tRNA(Asn/Gln) amidotransferase C subunit|nr:hypothetical protein [Anaerolineae bacterium]
MNQEINQEFFDHLVQLAELQLEPEEAEYMHEQLNKQLQSVAVLQSIPVDPDTPPAVHSIPYPPEVSQPTRADRWEPTPEPRRILELAPETQDGYIVAPHTPHTEL